MAGPEEMIGYIETFEDAHRVELFKFARRVFAFREDEE